MYDSSTKTRRDYLITGASLLSFSFFYGFMTSAERESTRYLFWAIGFFGSCMFYPLWLNFLSNVVKINNRFYKAFLKLSVILSASLALICIFSGNVVFERTDFGNEFTYTNAIIFHSFFLYHLLLLVIIFTVQIIWYRQSVLKRHRKQVFIIMVLATLATPVGFYTDLMIPIFTDTFVIPLGSVCILAPSLYVFYSMKKYKLFGITVSNVSQYTFTSVTVPIYVLDYTNTVILENTKAVEFLGETGEGKNISEIIEINDEKPDDRNFTTYYASKIVTVKTASGNRTCDMALTIDYDKYNDPICKIAVLKDITDINDALNRINEQNDKLEAALHEALEANKVKSEFLAKMSHEIRTPMNAITGMTELVLREDISDTVHEHTLTIKQAGSNLLEMINDLLDFSKIETGNMQIQKEKYSLASLVNDIINITRIRITDSEIRFVVYLESNLPDILIGDEVRIRQALINILGNAVKHTKKGYISLTVKGTVIDENNVNMFISVEDTGSGIKQEDIENLFEEYFQVNSTSSDGVGLGLAITKGIVMAMNGEISVESEFGKGSKFTMNIPQQIESPGKLATVENPDEKSTLIYDRRGLYTDSLHYAITDLGVKCDTATSRETFTDLVSNNHYSFIFIPGAQLKDVKDIISDAEPGSGSDSTTQIVLLTEFGETVQGTDSVSISMPVHVITAANVLNGITRRYLYNESNKRVKMFAAPDASILIVDDISTNLRVARGLLAPYKMDIDMRISGLEAIEAVKSKKYDLVFMDHRMPEPDGIETTKRIRSLADEDPYFADLPIIALTANAVTGMKELFMQNGFNDFMSKPIDTNMLNSVLEKWIPENKQNDIETSDITQYITDDSSSDNEIIPDSFSLLQHAMPSIDVSNGIKRAGGTIEFYIEILAAFLSEGIKRSKSINHCLETSDLSLYITSVHALKSASFNIGADKFSETAYDLEKAGLREDWDYINDNNSAFLKSFKNLLFEIKTALHISNTQTDSENKPQKNEQLQNELNTLKTALQEMDFDIINRSLDTLIKLPLNEEEKTSVRNISNKIILFDYDEAINIITKNFY